jgi:hypothetical protein
MTLSITLAPEAAGVLGNSKGKLGEESSTGFPMPQYAWLELDSGMWNLFTDKPNERVRKWANKEIALAALHEEGWTIAGPYPKRLAINKKPRQRFYGYGLMRTVH